MLFGGGEIAEILRRQPSGLRSVRVRSDRPTSRLGGSQHIDKDLSTAVRHSELERPHTQPATQSEEGVPFRSTHGVGHLVGVAAEVAQVGELLGSSERWFAEEALVSGDEHGGALGMVGETGDGSGGVGAEVELCIRRGVLAEDDGGESGGQHLKDWDVQPPNVQRREGKIPIHAMHVATKPRRLGVGGGIRRAYIAQSRLVKAHGGTTNGVGDDRACYPPETVEPARDLIDHESGGLNQGSGPELALAIAPVRVVEAVHDASRETAGVANVLQQSDEGLVVIEL
jgi:hypothetical protein